MSVGAESNYSRVNGKALQAPYRKPPAFPTDNLFIQKIYRYHWLLLVHPEGFEPS